MAAVRTGWWTRNTLPWVKRPAIVELSVTPTLGISGAIGTVSAAVGLSVAPSLDVVGTVRHAAQVELSVTPDLTVGQGTIPAAVGLIVTPTLTVDAVARVPASVDLTVTPVLGVAGAARQAAAVGLSVTPTLTVSAKVTTTYDSFPTVPAGTVNVALNNGAGAVQASSNTLQEGSCTASNATYRSAAVLPDSMATDLFWVEVKVGALSGAAGDRNVGAGVFSADGTKGVVTLWPASSNTATIYSWAGGTLTQQASLGSQVANTDALIRLVPSVSGGVVTWTVYLNGTPTALTWTDSSHVVDLPGRHPAAGFRRAYNFGQYPSRGVAALTAADI